MTVRWAFSIFIPLPKVNQVQHPHSQWARGIKFTIGFKFNKVAEALCSCRKVTRNNYLFIQFGFVSVWSHFLSILGSLFIKA